MIRQGSTLLSNIQRIGILSVVFLMLRWEGDGGSLAKLFVGGIFGFGMFILTWWVIAILIAPRVAVRESKEARGAVKIIRFQPWDQMTQLEFRNESYAEFLIGLNNRLNMPVLYNKSFCFFKALL